jgi:hypothetical protein
MWQRGPVGSASLTARRRQVSAAWDAYMHAPSRTGERPPDVRPEVAASWTRSTHRLPAPAAAAPLDDEAAVRTAWQASPVRTALAPIAGDVAATAEECGFVAAVTDSSGRILWTSGSPHMRDRAAAVHFVPGGRWDEASVGTNALDLALRLGRSATVFSAEHYSPCVHGWVCYAAPVTDPGSGEVIGVLDFSTTWERSHPMALAAVTAFAATLSRSLPHPAPTVARSGRVEGRPEDGPLRLVVLGHPVLEQAGLPLMTSRRQSEILLALALHPQGLSLQQLHAHVYGDQPVAVATLKAEMSRLRRTVAGALESRPYRLRVPVHVDALDVLDRVARGDAVGAVRAWSADLLPDSEAPVVTDLRLRLELAVRELVLRGRDPQAAVLLAQRCPADLEVVEHALALLPPRAPVRALLRATRDAALLG